MDYGCGIALAELTSQSVGIDGSGSSQTGRWQKYRPFRSRSVLQAFNAVTGPLAAIDRA